MTRRSFRSSRGAALVELALVTPVMLTLVMAALDLGRAFYTSMALTDAARAGAQYAATASSYNASQVQAKAAAASPLVTYTVDTPTRTCGCMSDAGAMLSSISCSTTCPTGGHNVTMVQVTARATFVPVAPLPGMPSSLAMQRTVSVRSQ